MQQILNKILDSSEPITIILSLAILGIVGIGVLYLRTVKKAAKNDYHALPEHTEAIRDELRMLRVDSNTMHTKQIEILAETRGLIKGILNK